MRKDRAADVGRMIVLAGVYVATAKLGLSLSVAHGNVTPVWPPTGISLAALVLFGPRMWPGVAAGAFIANATTPAGLLAAGAIAVGNTLEAVVGAALLRRARFDRGLERTRDVVALLVLAAAVSTTVSATMGTTTLWLRGDVPNYGFSWGLWWFGDAMGDLLVAPVLLVWSRRWHERHGIRHAVEVGVLIGALAGASGIAFFGGRWSYPFIVVPPLIWAAIRYRQRGATLGILIVASFAVWGTLIGSVPIGSATATESVTILQMMLSLIAVAILVLAATITERERSELLVVKKERQLADAQQIAHIGSWEWDIGEDRVTWSEELHRIYGLESRGFVGTYEGFLERVHPEDRPMVDATVKEAFRDPKQFSFDHRIVRPDGSERIIHGRGDVIVDVEGKPVSMVGTGQDITERKLLEAFREDFISNAAHELRTPITTMVGLTSLIAEHREEMTQEQMAGFIERLASNGERLRVLINDLLDLAGLQQGRPVIELQTVSVSLVVKGALEAVSPPPGTTIEVFVPEGIVVWADPIRLDQILVNLLSNAYRYGGRSVRVEAGRAEHLVAISVWDDGPGIPEDVVPRLFDPFTRGEVAAGGSGLGLTIVRMLAQGLGGEVAYEPGVPRGSLFIVRLRAA